ncbi:MAG: RNA polymerase sigma factor [Thalassospira sp.]|uniref:RNA polymerase sigma factor n=1 Tax=Thalassospira sp. TaxID=1912094 RepID=UPI0032EF9D82
MQNEKNTQQDAATLTEAELKFAHCLEQTLNQALGDGDNVTSIWSRLKPDQRARIAEDYLAKLQETGASPDDGGAAASFLQDGFDRYADLDAGFITQPSEKSPLRQQTPPSEPDRSDQSSAPSRAEHRYSPPPGYPADFNPLAGFPGLEPSTTGPRPEDVIAGALPGFGTPPGLNPVDILRGILPNGLERTNLRQPTPGAPETPAPTPAPTPAQTPAFPEAPGWPTPSSHPDQHDQHTDAQVPSDLHPQAGPAAPNFWPLWIDQQDTLLKQCLKLMSGNMDDAQDALSEAMVKASVKFEDSMDEIRNHRAWLSRIVHNACIDLHRQNRRKAEYHEETHGSGETPASPMTAPTIPSPEESYLTGERMDQLETVLLAMQEKLRKPLLMRCVQDRSYDEIAKALGLSNCAVRKRVQLAREHLKGSGIQ